MEIRIAHLYYDLANLYGDNGNLAVLSDYLREQQAPLRIDKLSVGDRLDFDAYDLIYLGSAAEGSLALAAADLLRHSVEITGYIEKGGRALFTGNSIELLGKTLFLRGKEAPGTGTFSYRAVPLPQRYMGEVILQDEQGRFIIGFQNQSCQLTGIEHPWCRVVKGLGAGPGSEVEGIRYKRFIGTYTIAPLLARNYFLAEQLCRELTEAKGLAYHQVIHPYDERAYQSFLRELQTENRQSGD